MSRNRKPGMSALPDDALLARHDEDRRAREIAEAFEVFRLAAAHRLTLRFERDTDPAQVGVDRVIARVRPLWPAPGDESRFACVVLSNLRHYPVYRLLSPVSVVDGFESVPDVPGDLLLADLRLHGIANVTDAFGPLDLAKPVDRGSGWSAVIEALALASRFRVPARFHYRKSIVEPREERHVEGVTLDEDRLRCVDRGALLKNARYRDARKRSVRAFLFSRVDRVTGGDLAPGLDLPLWCNLRREYYDPALSEDDRPEDPFEGEVDEPAPELYP